MLNSQHTLYYYVIIVPTYVQNLIGHHAKYFAYIFTVSFHWSNNDFKFNSNNLDYFIIHFKFEYNRYRALWFLPSIVHCVLRCYFNSQFEFVYFIILINTNVRSMFEINIFLWPKEYVLNVGNLLTWYADKIFLIYWEYTIWD